MIKGFTTADGVTHLVPKSTPLTVESRAVHDPFVGVDVQKTDGTSPDGRDALLAEIARLRRVIAQYQGTPQDGSTICPHCNGAGVMESTPKEW